MTYNRNNKKVIVVTLTMNMHFKNQDFGHLGWSRQKTE
jgi:hypothetical protein